jgi:hypothetical protein
VFEVVLAGLLAGGGAGLALVLAGYRALIVVRDLSAAAVALALRRRGAGAAPPSPRSRVARRRDGPEPLTPDGRG